MFHGSHIVVFHLWMVVFRAQLKSTTCLFVFSDLHFRHPKLLVDSGQK